MKKILLMCVLINALDAYDSNIKSECKHLPLSDEVFQFLECQGDDLRFVIGMRCYSTVGAWIGHGDEMCERYTPSWAK